MFISSLIDLIFNTLLIQIVNLILAVIFGTPTATT